MKKALAVMVACMVILVSSAAADIPKLINYQGMLTSPEGEPLSGYFDLTFAIYNAPADGQMRWEETHPGVLATNGLFNVILGSETAGGINLDFSEEYWLEIQVGVEPMSERLKFTSVGYAYRAEIADSAMVAVSAPTGGGWTDDGSVVRLANGDDFVCIGTPTPSGKLTVGGGDGMIKGGDGWNESGDEASLFLGDNNHGISAVYGQGARIWTFDGADHRIEFGGHTGTDYLTIKMDSGNVGIGTPNPNRKLHIVGDNPRILIEGSSGSPEVNFKNTGDAGSEVWALYKHSATGDLRFYQNGDKITIKDSTGYCGMGTTTPRARLHVQCTALDSSALYAESNDLAGYGVYGKNHNSGTGVIGDGWYGVTGVGYEDGVGVYGRIDGHGFGGVGVQGWTEIGLGVVGQCDSGYAGYFEGDVHIIGTLTGGKSAFKIDHPLDPDNKYLYHSYIGSPEVKNVYDGVLLLDGKGEAWVELPDWFEALNKDFRYQLTAIGTPGPDLYIAQEISGNRFQISGGTPGMKVSWQVTGIRQDPYADANRIPVEEEKTPAEQGKYLHPEAYGMPDNLGVSFELYRDGRP